MEQLRIFVSHSSQDMAIADRFVCGLRGAGADVWYDEHNLGAGHLMDEIQRELGRRPIFIVLLSKAAFASKWVKREAGWAYGLADRDCTRLILPVTVHPIDRNDFDPETGWLFLEDFKRIEASGYHPYPEPELIERTCRALGLALQGETPPSTQPQLQENVDDLLAHAKALIAQKQYTEAVPLLERVTQQAPDRFEGWVNLGLVYDLTRRFRDAVQADTRALALDSAQAYAFAWNNRKLLLDNPDLFAGALSSFENGFDPTNPYHWHAKARTLRAQGRTMEARDAEQQAQALEAKS